VRKRPAQRAIGRHLNDKIRFKLPRGLFRFLDRRALDWCLRFIKASPRSIGYRNPMPLFRTAIIAAAVIALLPSDRAQQERLQQTAIDAAHWALTFCDRNAKTCENAGAAWETFKAKAEFAAGVAYDVALTHVFADGALPAGLETGSTAAHPAEPARGTLTERDLKPGWRGTLPRHDG
jgi:hypothetical protein